MTPTEILKSTHQLDFDRGEFAREESAFRRKERTFERVDGVADVVKTQNKRPESVALLGESSSLRRNDERFIIVLGEGFDVVGFAQSANESRIKVGAVLVRRIRMTSEEEELEFLLRELTDTTSPVFVLTMRITLQGGLE